MEHECVIGFSLWDDYHGMTTLSELIKHIETMREYAKIQQERNRLYPYNAIKPLVYELSDYGDKRKSTDLCRYDYCPFCGKKIDWSAKVEE